ncbi:MAG: glycosyltransferase [Saprospiraceae bacterium]|nr:glycosyltransferase [Saprospiraceae bacterium]
MSTRYSVTSDNRILLIHYYYPPLRSAAVLRNYYFSLAFANRFREVLVVTSSNSRKLQQEELFTLPNMSVHEAFTFDYRTLAGIKTKNNHWGENQKKNKLYYFISRLQKTLPFHFIIGEGGFVYIYHAFKQGKRIINSGGVDVIYSSFGPYADHLVAYLLKRQFPGIKWIADFRDLQIEPLYKNVFLKKWQVKIERKLLQKADLVTTVSEGLANQLKKYGRSTLAIPRGVQRRLKSGRMYDKFTICYTGSLYRQFRDAAYFFEELAGLIRTEEMAQDDVQFLYAGRDSAQFQIWVDEYNLQKIYVDLGFISKSATWEVQNQSHLQLLLTTSTSDWNGVFTGKLFEYLESGNGIIVLVNGVRDLEFESLMNNTAAGKVFYEPPIKKSELANYLLDQYRSWKKTGAIEMEINIAFLDEQMSWDHQVEKMLEGISSLR